MNHLIQGLTHLWKSCTLAQKSWEIKTEITGNQASHQKSQLVTEFFLQHM